MRKIIISFSISITLVLVFTACSESESPISVTGVTLNKTTLELIVGDTERLTVAITPGDAANQNVTWVSSNPIVATVDDNGLATAQSAGATIITVTAECGSHTTTCEVTVEGALINGIIWATRNVDAPGIFAENPESEGRLYQWNRRQDWAVTGSVFGWDSSIPTGTGWIPINDPCPTGWRVPTHEDFRSLIDSGSTWAARSGMNGRLFGTHPNQIFLPAVGGRIENGGWQEVGIDGNYWARDARISTWGNSIGFGENGVVVNETPRARGLSVRCVRE